MRVSFWNAENQIQIYEYYIVEYEIKSHRYETKPKL